MGWIGSRRSKTPWAGGAHLPGSPSYRRAFRYADRAVLLDGSIMSLYSQRAARAMYETIGPQGRVIFIFRDPVKRFFSDFDFIKQLHVLPESMTLEAFLGSQEEHPYYHHPLWKGSLVRWRYSMFVRAFLDVFARHQILFLGLGALRRDPLSVMNQLCSFLCLDPSFYQTYRFNVYNPTHGYRYAALDAVYLPVVLAARQRLLRYPALFGALQQVWGRCWEPVYQRLNHRPAARLPISEAMRGQVAAYYADENAQLTALAGVPDLLND